MPLGQTAQELRIVVSLASEFYGVHPAVVESILVQESSFNPNVPNGDGGAAVGMGQFHIPRWQEVIGAHPEIQQQFQVTTNPIGRNSPEASIWAVAASLADQLTSNGGDYLAAVAHHNGSGPAAQAYAQTVLNRAQGASSMTQHGVLPTVGDVVGDGGGLGEPSDIIYTEAWQNFLARLEREAQDARQRGEFANAVALERLVADLTAARDARGFTYNRALATLDADLQIRIDEAREQGDRETQIVLTNLQAEINAEASRVGFEREQWILDKQQAFEAAQAQGGRDFISEQNKLDRDAAEKAQAQAELNSFKRDLMGFRERAKELLATTLGNNPLRAAAFASGRVQRGTTPSDVARAGLQATLNQPLPSVGPNASINQIRGEIQKIPQAPPSQAGVLGFRGGGVIHATRNGQGIARIQQRLSSNAPIDMARNRTGSFQITPDSPTPDFGGNTGIGIIVGEGDGSPGKARELLEIIEGPTGIDKIRVIPIAARAAGGLEIDTSTPRLGTSGLSTTTTQPRPSIAKVAQRLTSGQRAPGTSGVAAVGAQAPSTFQAPTDIQPPAQTTALAVAEPQLLAEPEVAGATEGGQFGAGEVATIISRWPNFNETDAAFLIQAAAFWRNQPGAEAFAVTLDRYVQAWQNLEAGLWTLEQANEFIQGGPVPTIDPDLPGDVPEDEIEFGDIPFITPGVPSGVDPAEAIDVVTGILDIDPSLWDANIVNWFLERGMFAVANLIQGVIDGTLDPELAVQALQDWISTIQVTIGGEEVDIDALRRSIQDLYRNLGINPDFVTDTALDTPGIQLGSLDLGQNLPGLLGTIGIEQQFVQDSLSGIVYVIEGGQLTPIASNLDQAQERFGINPRDVISVHPTTLAQFGEVGQVNQPTLTSDQQQMILVIMHRINFQQPPSAADIAQIVQFSPQAAEIMRQYAQGLIPHTDAVAQLQEIINTGQSSVIPIVDQSQFEREEIGGFPAPRFPLVEPNTGLILPSIRKVANIWGRLDPGTKRIITQAYELAGLGTSAAGILNNELDFFTPQGTFDPRQVAAFG